MSIKKFAGIDGTVISPEVEADFEAANKFDKVKVGSLGIYFREGLRSKFVSFDRLERAFLRVTEFDGKLCCGTNTYRYFHLVLVVDGKEYSEVLSENEQAMRDALKAISAAAPNVAIGYVKPV